jgi:hypothetical protein
VKVYRVGNAHYATQDEAKKASKALDLPWSGVDLSLKLRDLIEYINGVVTDEQVEATPKAAAPKADPTPTLNYGSQSVEIDDLWDTLPLARRLHFAALAIEDARDITPALAPAAPAPAASGADDLL